MAAPNSKDIAIKRMGKAVLLWNYADAPVEFANLAISPDDNDFIAYFPADVEFNETIMHASRWGATCKAHKQLDGSTIVIGSHV